MTLNNFKSKQKTICCICGIMMKMIISYMCSLLYWWASISYNIPHLCIPKIRVILTLVLLLESSLFSMHFLGTAIDF